MSNEYPLPKDPSCTDRKRDPVCTEAESRFINSLCYLAQPGPQERKFFSAVNKKMFRANALEKIAHNPTFLITEGEQAMSIAAPTDGDDLKALLELGWDIKLPRNLTYDGVLLRPVDPDLRLDSISRKRKAMNLEVYKKSDSHPRTIEYLYDTLEDSVVKIIYDLMIIRGFI